MSASNMVPCIQLRWLDENVWKTVRILKATDNFETELEKMRQLHTEDRHKYSRIPDAEFRIGQHRLVGMEKFGVERT